MNWNSMLMQTHTCIHIQVCRHVPPHTIVLISKSKFLKQFYTLKVAYDGSCFSTYYLTHDILRTLFIAIVLFIYLYFLYPDLSFPSFLFFLSLFHIPPFTPPPFSSEKVIGTSSPTTAGQGNLIGGIGSQKQVTGSKTGPAPNVRRPTRKLSYTNVTYMQTP